MKYAEPPLIHKILKVEVTGSWEQNGSYQRLQEEGVSQQV